MHYDVFNGDADGITALLQLRLAEPKSSTLVTGIKRDIKLLKQVLPQTDVCGVTILGMCCEGGRESRAGRLQPHLCPPTS